MLSRCMGAVCAVCLFGVNVMAKDAVTFGTNWTAQGEHGGYYQAVAEGIYDAGTPCSGAGVCRVVQPSANSPVPRHGRARPRLVHRTRGHRGLFNPWRPPSP